MSWTTISANGLVVSSEDFVLPDTTTDYMSEVSFLKVDPTTESKNVTIVGTMDSGAVKEVGLDLYGAYEAGGTKFLLKSDVFTVFAIGDKDTRAGVIDINDYPAPYYYLGATTGDTEVSTLTVHILNKP